MSWLTQVDAKHTAKALELLPVDAAAVVLVELRKEHLRDRIPAGHWGGRSAR